MAIKQQELKETMINNFMPYAMKSISDRALPDVRDGLKPVHRRIIYKMHEKGITKNKELPKCNYIVGEILKIHGHGNTSVYEALAKLTEQYEGDLHPFIEGEGTFGKKYSTDKPSADRYTFARLNGFSEEMFNDFDKDVVQILGQEKDHIQPVVLPCTFPNVLVKANDGIAVGHKCTTAAFNLSEVCDTTIAYIKNKDIDIIDYLKAPDFATGGQIVYNKNDLIKIYNTGLGSITLRSKWRYDEDAKCIEVYEIPYNTNSKAIVDKINFIIKEGKIKDILDVRDETGFNKKIKKEELKITIDIKKHTNVNKLMGILFKRTPLESTLSVNMNCLVNNRPKVLSIKGVLNEWLKFRKSCIIKAMQFDINDKSDKLHTLQGLKKILLDIDKTIKIIRHSEENSILNNLIQEFDIDEIQAENVANMKLRNINKDYILKQIKDIDLLSQEVEDLKSKINNEQEIQNIIISDLERVKNKYGKPRNTEIIYDDNLEDITKVDLIEDYGCTIVYTQNYIKKVRRNSDNHKLKEGEIILDEIPSTNKSKLIFFTNKANRYIMNSYDLEDLKPSHLGQFIPNLIDLEEGEEIIKIVSIEDENKGCIVSVFENGKINKTPVNKFISNYVKLTNCYNTDSKLIDIDYISSDSDIFLISAEGKALITNSKGISSKASRNSMGVQGMNLGINENNKVVGCIINVTHEFNFELETKKGKIKEFMLDDVAPTGKANEERQLFKYIYGRRNNQGNFVINTRTNNDEIVSFKINR